MTVKSCFLASSWNGAPGRLALYAAKHRLLCPVTKLAQLQADAESIVMERQACVAKHMRRLQKKGHKFRPNRANSSFCKVIIMGEARGQALESPGTAYHFRLLD